MINSVVFIHACFEWSEASKTSQDLTASLTSWIICLLLKQTKKTAKKHSDSELCIIWNSLNMTSRDCFCILMAPGVERGTCTARGGTVEPATVSRATKKEQFGKQTWNPISIYIFTNMARLCAYGPWSVRCPLGADACLLGPGGKQDCCADNWPKKTSLPNNCLFRSAKKCVSLCVSD